jgi:hypothetical protein
MARSWGALQTKSASDTPIGQSASGDWPAAGAVLVEDGVGAGRLIGRQGIVLTEENDRRHELVGCVKGLVTEFDSEVAFIFHWFSGWISKEEVNVSDEVRVPVESVDKLVNDLKEDVRYIVLP